MADPRIIPPADRKQKLSPLMQAKAAVTTGEKVNVCPFGCEDDDLDENGYCRHLVGFSNDGKKMEPMITDERGRRVVRVDVEEKEKGKFTPVYEEVRRSDKLVQITVSSRVYRDVDKSVKESA